MTVNGLLAILQRLADQGCGDEGISAHHDGIYVPGKPDTFASDYPGVVWDDEYECWEVFT